MKRKSEFLTLEVRDGIRALFVAVGTSVLTAIMDVLNAGLFVFDWKKIGIVAFASTGAYILKNWLTNSKDQLLKKE